MELHEYGNWLAENQRNSIEVYNGDTQKLIDKKVDQSFLEQYGNAESYFLELMNDGVKTIAVQRMIKNGSGYRRDGFTEKFQLKPNQQPTNDRVVVNGGSDHAQAASTRQQQNLPLANPNPMGNNLGLSAPEIMDNFTKAKLYDDMKTRHDRLERKNDDLTAENKKLDRQLLEYQLGVQGRPGAIDKLFEKLTPEAIGQIGQMIMMAKQGNQNPALSGAETENLSRVKSEVIEQIKRNDVPDDLVAMAYRVIERWINKDQEFISKYNQLLQEAHQKQQQ